MLKGKKGLYILLPIVALVWGAIIMQVVGAFSDQDPVLVDSNIDMTVVPIKTKERDTFTLSVIERDPFLGTLYQPKKKIVAAISKPKVKKPALVWPSITYKGVVSGQNTGQAIYLIEINGNDELMRVKQTLSDVRLVKGFSNSVRLQYKGKTKDFKIVN
ncbi:hypothetical protein [Aquimarina pacifica]|uniref:hypothetical protein n=1 Tax=Aquimarina pacifica TaxID=1296415 RepID=UPI00046F9916|nr:hypothetical protein [Aquimarina pacifica]